MTEWYVLMHGYGSTWEAIKIVQGRNAAVGELTHDMPLTPDEGTRIRAFLERTVADGDSILVVGNFDAKGRRVLDRKITRVPCLPML